MLARPCSPGTRHQLRATYTAAGIPVEGLDFYQTPDWFENLADACIGPGEVVTALSAGRTILPLRAGHARLGPFAGRQARGLSNFYSCRFSPPGLAEEPGPAETAFALGRQLKQAGYARLRFDALDEGVCSDLSAGLAKAGWLTESFPQFGNWHLNADGLAFADYWASRPGKLRNTGTRRRRSLLDRMGAQIVQYSNPADAGRAIAAYDYVAARSWQKHEPFPCFLPGLIRYGLAASELVVWVLLLNNAPAAAQIWVSRQGRATIFKLAFDTGLQKLSAGTVLTMCAIEAALDKGGLREIDFGWGDDPYKQQWLPERSQRFGLAAYNPATALGLASAARNYAPKILQGTLGRLTLKR